MSSAMKSGFYEFAMKEKNPTAYDALKLATYEAKFAQM